MIDSSRSTFYLKIINVVIAADSFSYIRKKANWLRRKKENKGDEVGN